MNKSKNITIFVAFMFILLLTGAIFLFYYQKQRYSDIFFEYNGFAIHKVQDKNFEEYKIQFFIEGREQPFLISSRFNPRYLEEIPIYDNLGEDIIKEKVYVTMEPSLSSKATIAFSEINKYLENPFLFNLPTFPALRRPIENNSLPVITCDHVSDSIGVILFEIGSKNEIYSKEGCVIVEAITEDDLIKAADRLSLTVLGIMKP